MRKITRFIQIQAVLALLALTILAGTAQAGLLCRSDPVVILTNGVTLDIGASISTLPWQVQEVHYELHIPQGVRMLLAIHTPAWLTSQETFTAISDQAPDQYQVITTAKTTDGNATVTADTVLVSALHIKLGYYSASGVERTPLSVWFRGSR